MPHSELNALKSPKYKDEYELFPGNIFLWHVIY